MVDVARALMGLGAAVGGQAPQFRQQMMQEDELARKRAIENESAAEKRRQTLFADSAAAASLLKEGDTQGVLSLMKDRFNILSKIPDVDTSHTQRYVQLAEAANRGNRDAMNQLQFELDNAVQAGRAYNQLGSAGSTPASFRALQLQAQAAGLPEGSPEYQDFMRYGGAAGDMGAAKTITYNNGTVLKITRVGAPEVYGPNGQLVTDEAQKERILKEARDEGRAYEGDVATARARGTAEEGRAQNIITEGLAAADSTAVLRRSLELLNRVETGGFNRVSLAAKRLFGIEGADEGELSANLGKAVLSQLRSTFGAAFTEKEGQRLEAIEAGFSSSPETNRRLLKNALTIAERSAQRAIRRAEQRDDYETADEIEAALDFDLAEIEQAFAEGDTGGSGGAGGPAPNPEGPRVIRFDAQGNRING